MKNIDLDDLGFLGPIDDLQSRVDALGEGDVPAEWTPEHVGARMIEAFEIMRRSGGARVGPRQHANGWPEMMREFADLIDADARAQAMQERMEAVASVPSADEVSRMDEALLWPMHHLDGKRIQADALMFWAFATATGREMAGMLHARRKRAIALADEMMRRANARPHAGDCRSIADQWRAEMRWQIASEVAGICNTALAASPKGQHAAIRKEAKDALRARIEEANCLPVRVLPHQAVPGRALIPKTIERQRKIAMETVAKALRRAGVPVR